MEANLQKKLMNVAGSLLRRRAYSRGELAASMSRFAEPEQIRPILDLLEDRRLLDDEEYAYSFALLRLTQKGWGPKKVSKHLERRLVKPDVVRSVLERICREIGERNLLEDYLEKHCQKRGWPSDRVGVLRLASHLQQRGFSSRLIHSTLRQRIAPVALEVDDMDLGD